MRKYFTGFILGLLLIPIIVYAATFSSYDQLKTELQSIMQLKKAVSSNGQNVVVIKFEGLLQDFNVRHCHIFYMDEAMGSDATLSLSTSFETYGSFSSRNPERPLGNDESLCWPILISEGYAGTVDTAGIDLATNRLVVTPQGYRCDSGLPFDGAGRPPPNNGTWDNWYWLQGSMIGTDNSTGVVARCHLEGG